MRWSVGLLLSVISTTSASFQTEGLLKLYAECAKTDWQSCLKIKLLTGMEKLRNVEMIPVTNGISFVDENFPAEFSRPPSYLSQRDLEEGLPRAAEDRNRVLDSLLVDEVLELFSKYTLRMKLSSLRYPIEQARGKGKKHGHLMLMPMMMAASFIPIAIGALAILAGKALIVGKMALLLTGILGIKKLFSNHHDDDDHQRAMKRISDFGTRLRSDMMSHRMAYRDHPPIDLLQANL